MAKIKYKEPEVVQVQPIIEKKGKIQVKFKITNQMKQVVNILIAKGITNKQLLPRETLIIDKKDISFKEKIFFAALILSACLILSTPFCF